MFSPYIGNVLYSEVKLSANFTLGEYTVSKGKPGGFILHSDMTVAVLIELTRHATLLQAIRDVMGIPFRINSGFRPREYNDSIPGAASNSQHIYGKAADISCEDVEGLYQLALQMWRGGIGDGRHLFSPYIHLDTREGNARWTY